MANIWIIGPTGSGKSTLADRLATETGIPVLETGSFCREICEPEATADLLSKTAASLLANNHRYFSKKIAAELTGGDWIIVGARNPIDFVDSFSPKNDVVINLSAGNAKTPFEYHGIAAINRIVHFLLAAEIIKPSQYQMLDADGTEEDWYATFHIEL